MLRGHLDGASYSRVWGWAANTLAPDGIVRVSIFVNGRKVVEMKCNHYRPDLKSMGLGEGRCGFSYDFPEKLDETSNKRVEVRFSETGEPLANGRVLLSKEGVSTIPNLEERHARRLVRLPAPANQRELFELLALLDPEYGMYDLLRRLDFNGWTARNAHEAAYGKLSTTQSDARNQSSSYVRDYFYDLLSSNKFQESIIPALLQAYAEKHRLLFVHIPKCAGTDLSENLRTRYPTLDQRTTAPEWTGKEELFRELRDFVQLTRFFDTIYVRGHMALNYYLENQLARPSDRLFSIMRDPLEIPISAANFVTMRIRQAVEQQRLDPATKGWLGFLGINVLPNELSDEFAAQLCLKAFYSSNIVRPNSMCYWLGGGDAQTVLARLAEHNVEVTDTVNYNRWLVDRWGITSGTRRNESVKFIAASSLKPKEREYLREISGEDLKLYAALQNSLSAARRSWIVGRELLTR